MNLPQLIAQADANSYYSRSDADKYSAASSAGSFLFNLIKREMRGYFIKFDTTSIVLTPGTQTYSLPADFSSLLYFGERQNAVENYHPLGHVSIQNALSSMQSVVGWSDYPDALMDGYSSIYSFDGPYLPAITATTPGAPQIFKVDITPQIQQTCMTMLAYIAKWVPLVNDSSVVMLPDVAEPALLSLTSAYLLDNNDDNLATTFRSRAGLDAFQNVRGGEIAAMLSMVRQTQITANPTVRMF